MASSESSGNPSIPSKGQQIFITDLPTEIRHHILSYAIIDGIIKPLIEVVGGYSLVRSDRGQKDSHDLGRRQKLHNLLNIRNKKLYADTHCIVFSRHKFLMLGSFASNLRFLKANRGSLQHLRNIEFQLGVNDIQLLVRCMALYENNYYKEHIEKDWHEALSLILNNCNLGTLTLTINSWTAEDDYFRRRGHRAEYAGTLRDVHNSMVAPLKGLGDNGLKAFCLYWGTSDLDEIETEKEVMGEKYKETKKIMMIKRAHESPWAIRGQSAWSSIQISSGFPEDPDESENGF